MDTEKENWYRTGAVAKLLGTSQHRIRELARAGVIESEVRNGYRYVPGREVERLQKDGLPPMPANIDTEPTQDGVHGVQSGGPPRPSRGSPELYAEPSRQLAQSKEKVIRMEHAAQEMRIQQEIHKMDRTAREEARRDREARNIQLWRNGYIQRIVAAVPGEACADACERVEAVLKAVPPYTDVTRQVNEIIDSKLAPVREREARQQALAGHRQRMARFVEYIRLPDGATSDEREEAREAALAHLVERVRIGAADWQARKAIDSAIQGVVDRVNQRQQEEDRKQREEQHRRRIEWAVLLCSPPGATPAEFEQARQRVQAALERLPVTAKQSEIDATKQEALAPIEAAIKERQEREEREQNERTQRLASQRQIEFHIALLQSRVETRLQQLGARGTIRFEDDSDRYDLRDRVTRKIRPIFVREINASPAMSDADVIERIADLVDEHYERFCD